MVPESLRGCNNMLQFPMWWSEASAVEMSTFILRTSLPHPNCTLYYLRGCAEILCRIVAFVVVPAKYALSGSRDKSVCIANLDKGIFHNLHGHDGPVRKVAGSIRYLRALSSAGNCIKLWELRQ